MEENIKKILDRAKALNIEADKCRTEWENNPNVSEEHKEFIRGYRALPRLDTDTINKATNEMRNTLMESMGDVYNISKIQYNPVTFNPQFNIEVEQDGKTYVIGTVEIKEPNYTIDDVK